MINLILSLVAHGQNTVQSLAHITFRLQTLICTTPNPRLCGDGYLNNEGTRSGLAVSSAHPTHTNLAFPSHPHTRKMLYSSSMHHRPVSLRAHVRHIPRRYKSPLPLSSGGRGNSLPLHKAVFICSLSINLSAMVLSLTCRPIFAL